MNRALWIGGLLIAVLVIGGCSSGKRRKGQLCQSSTDCNTGVCLGGSCTTLAPCKTQGDCEAGVCRGGFCWEESCSSDSDCPYGTCIDGACIDESVFTSDTPDQTLDRSSEDATVVGTDTSKGDQTVPGDTQGTKNDIAGTDSTSGDQQTMDNPDAQIDGVTLKDGADATTDADGKHDSTTDSADALQADLSDTADVLQTDLADSADVAQMDLADSADVQQTDLADNDLSGDAELDQSDLSSDQPGADATQLVSCDPNNDNPANSTDLVVQVSITFDITEGTWSAPAKCAWQCEATYCKDSESCVQSKSVACNGDNNNPLNSTDLVSNVSVACGSDGNFEAPTLCEWKCDASWCKEGDSCVQSKMVACNGDNNPPNSSSTVADVPVNCLENGDFDAPVDCQWTCNPGWILNAGKTGCVRASNCYHYLKNVPGAPDGAIVVDPPGAEAPKTVYCDMTAGGLQIEYGFGPYDAAKSGWIVAGSSHLGQTTNQNRFLAYYNTNLGLFNLDTGFSYQGGCCFKDDDLPQSDAYLRFGSSLLHPYDGTSVCSTANFGAQPMQFALESNVQPHPLPADFFSNNPPGVDAQCTTAGNPAVFWSLSLTSGCKELKDLGFGSGVYLLRAEDATTDYTKAVYCSMSDSTQYEFGFGTYHKTYAGWSLMSLSQWKDTVLQQAFVGLYNKLGGFRNLDIGFRTGNCCFALTSQAFLNLGGKQIFTARLNNIPACSDDLTLPIYRFKFFSGNISAPMKSNFFETNPPGSGTQCNNNDNPGMFVKATAF